MTIEFLFSKIVACFETFYRFIWYFGTCGYDWFGTRGDGGVSVYVEPLEKLQIYKMSSSSRSWDWCAMKTRPFLYHFHKLLMSFKYFSIISYVIWYFVGIRRLSIKSKKKYKNTLKDVFLWESLRGAKRACICEESNCRKGKNIPVL